MRLLVARCEVSYTGRLDAFLPEAVRLLLLKSDGSVLVHADSGGYKPLNWMTPPTVIEEGEGLIVVRKRAGKTEDKLEIRIAEVLSDLDVPMDEVAGLEKDGVEKHLQEALAERPECLESELRLVRREWMTEVGPVDLMCRDCDDGWVAVEIKRVGTIEAVEQLTRYLGFIRVDPAKERCRGILAAQSFKPQAVTLAESRGIRCVEVDLAVLRGEREPETDALRLANWGLGCGLEVVARRVGEQRGDALEPDLVRDEPLPRIRAAREERQRGADVPRCVVEGAAQRQLLVVEAVRVDPQRGVRLAPAEEDDRAAGTNQLDRALPRLLGACRFDHDVRALTLARLAAEERHERAALRPAADDLGRAAGVCDAGAQHQADRAGADDRDAVAPLDLCALDAAQAARERLDHRRHLGCETPWDGQQVDLSDRGRDEQILGVGAVQELERLAALVAGGRVCGDDALAGRDVDPAELVTERARQLAQEDGMAAPESLQVGAVRERHLDLDEHVAGAGLRTWDLFEPQVPNAVEAQRSHGVKTTFSAAPER